MKKYILSLSFGKDSLALLLKLLELNYPIDEVVFYDTGKEFKAIYNLRDKIKILLQSKGIKFTELYPDMSFDYKMFDKPVCKRGTKTIHRYGFSWCGGVCRWGTSDKIHSIDKYCNKTYGKDNFMQYIGIAVDESERLEKERKSYKLFPLADLNMTEADCLQYCYSQGYDWSEETDNGNSIDLYNVLFRVSCWCCRNKNLWELYNIHNNFKNTYWLKLKQIENRLCENMKQKCSLTELEKLFENGYIPKRRNKRKKEKSMSKFEYMNFTGGCSPCEFVTHAKKFTKEKAVELCISENDWQFDEDEHLRKPTIEDITERYVKWYVKVPEGCGYDCEGGCYSYCSKNDKGSFPVWLIDFDDLTK